MPLDMAVVKRAVDNAQTRAALWQELIKSFDIASMAEIGVFRGTFAEEILKSCTEIKKYYMVDPWRNLENWNKPANRTNEVFGEFYAETMARTEFAREKRVVLRGKTSEVIDQIPDESLDLAYVDGDHTLRGITIDLIKLYPKVKPGGYIGGDDLCRSIWQHSLEYEPTMVYPFALYFAEAVSARLIALPFRQFLIEKNTSGSFELIDTTGYYTDPSMKSQLLTAVRAILDLSKKQNTP